MRRKLKGIRRKRNKWEVYVDVDRQRTRCLFDLSTPLEELRQWQIDERKRRMPTRGTDPGVRTFADEIAADVAATAHWPTACERTAHLALWCRALGGDRPSHSITSGEIQAILDRWTATPPPARVAGQPGRPCDPAGLRPATIRKRRSTLQSFFTRRNGVSGANPVRGTTTPDVGEPEDRSLDYAAIERVIAAMSTYRSTRRGAPPVLALAKVRARVLAYTGIPPALLQQITPHDLTLAGPAPTVRVPYRLKGKVAPRRLPLTPQGLEAFRIFHRAHAYGPFVVHAVNVSFQIACGKVDINPRTVSLYALRHSFLTALYRASRDLATVARFAMHREGSRVTARYAKGANPDVDRAAAAALGAAIADTLRNSAKEVPAVHDSVHDVPAKYARFS